MPKPRSWSVLLLAWLPVAVMCGVIFLLSRDSNSGRHSAEVLSWLLGLVHMASPRRVAAWNPIFRKLSHVGVYFILAGLVYRGIALERPARFYFSAAWGSLVFVFLYATTDEWHQALVPHRGPALSDVLIDTGGGAICLLLILLLVSLQQRRRARLEPEQALTP